MKTVFGFIITFLCVCRVLGLLALLGSFGHDVSVGVCDDEHKSGAEEEV